MKRKGHTINEKTHINVLIGYSSQLILTCFYRGRAGRITADIESTNNNKQTKIQLREEINCLLKSQELSLSD